MKNPFQHGPAARHDGSNGAGASNDPTPETLPLTLGVASSDSADEQPTDRLAALGLTPTGPDESAAESPDAQASSISSRRRRRWPIVAAATAFIVAGTGAVAYGQARKTVELDVNGKTSQVVTFSGDVSSLLDEQGVKVGPHDVVAPAKTSALHKGDEVVVRSGHKVTYEADGVTHSVWVTDLDANDALDTLNSRGDNVRLVASRSDADGRVSLPLPLNVDGPVNLIADGKTRKIQNAGRTASAVLDSAGVAVGPLDRVSVVSDPPSVSLVVQRVKVANVTSTSNVAFGTKKVSDPNRYKDLPAVVTQKGVPGVHTVVKRVTTVDGKVESSTVVTDKVTTSPTTQIVSQGTKERPKPSSSGSSSSSSSSSSSPSSAPAKGATVSGDAWSRLAACESGGNPAAVSSNGLYYGLYQFSVGTWHSLGGSGLPSQASPAEQTARAQALQARSGWGQWPACASKLGLR